MPGTSQTAHITLASASPRRRELLRQLTPNITVAPSHIDETPHHGEPPRDFALRMAQEKALACGAEGWVVAGDTVVALGAQILGKPADTPNPAQDATTSLATLSGRAHEVWSGWAVRGPHGITSGVSRGVVTFRDLTRAEIDEYVSTGEPLDKAGGYGIQGRGGRLVAGLEGSFDGVMGLPTAEVAEALLGLGALTPTTPALLRAALSLRERLRAASWRSGRGADAARLLAVSKFHPVERVVEALGYDLRDFGESYLQELEGKRAALKVFNAEPSLEPTWHYIGALQTNKARRVGVSAGWVHGVSRVEEARKLSEGALERARLEGVDAEARPLRLLLQVNIAGEASKGGAHPEHVGALLEACEGLSGVRVEGLMVFPPLGDPEESRPHFRAARALRDSLATPSRPLSHLSMGTSHDFEVAAEEGATWVRVGTALFGERG